MDIIWRKIWRDMWGSKFRTALVVLSTAVGVFALGFVYGTSGVLTSRLTESHQASVPPDLTFYTSAFNQDLVEAIKREPGVVDAEGIVVTLIRWRKDAEADWQDGALVAHPDFDAQRMNKCELLDGHWPDENTLDVERLSARYFGIHPDSHILIEVGRRERSVPVTGIMRHPQAAAPPLDNAVFFATPETYAWLTGEPESFRRLYVRLEASEVENADAVGKRLQDRLERMGVGVGLYTVTDPDAHPLQEVVDAVGLILTVLGALSLGLSGFLIINMMNALISQQVWQIGVMKVVGATSWRVLLAYLAMALTYGLLALLLAVLPGAIAAHLLASVLLGLFNVDVGAFRLMPLAVGIQVAVGLIVPVLAALVPVIGGARITPHQAISSYGLGMGFGRSWLDRLIGRVRRLPRPLTLSLRNTFRRKARIALTLITLTLGGVMFIIVLSVSATMNNTLEVLLDDLGFDVLIGFKRSYRVAQLVEVTESVPGVTRAEVWDQRAAQLSLAGGEEREVYLWGVPPDTEMFNPRIVSGRGLLPEDDRAILLNSKIADDEGFQVGDVITLTVGDQQATWTVVGLILNVNNLQRDNFVSFDALARVIGNVNRGGLLMVASEKHDALFQQQLIRELRASYDTNHLEVAILQSAGEVRQMNKAVFDAITYLMLVMAFLAAMVGSIGLMSTMSINVVERGREIGVMRAIGAKSAVILGIFVVEGMLVGVLSWLLAVPLSYPGARLFNILVSTTLFRIPLDFDYSISGMLLWLVIVVILSGLASLWPALSATQVTVREALAYE